jgi:hypothetical protein
MTSLLFGVSASDPVTYLVIAALLALAAFAACYVPARRALPVDPNRSPSLRITSAQPAPPPAPDFRPWNLGLDSPFERSACLS